MGAGFKVAPFTGAWIEIQQCTKGDDVFEVAPFTGAWIEISNRSLASLRATVAPFTGAWIEILPQARSRPVMSSLPSRERGLKYDRTA